jgi:Ca2+-binding EF-hand superfamily protein
MGGCSSKTANPAGGIPHLAAGIPPAAIKKLLKVFRQINADNTDFAKVEELINYFAVGESPIIMRMIRRAWAAMDENGDGELDFSEFASAIWSYCTIGKNALVVFTFDLFDTSSDGHLTQVEATQMMRGVSAGLDAAEAEELATAVNETVKQCIATGSKGMSISDFALLTLQFPAMLYDAFSLQTHFQNKVLGCEFWLREACDRLGDEYLQQPDNITAKILYQQIDLWENNNASKKGKTKLTAYTTDAQVQEFVQQCAMSYVEGSVVFRRLEHQINITGQELDASPDDEVASTPLESLAEEDEGQATSIKSSNVLLYEAMQRRQQAMELVFDRQAAVRKQSEKDRLRAGISKKDYEAQNAKAVQAGGRKLSARPGQLGANIREELLRKKLGQIGTRLTPAYSRRKVKLAPVAASS